MIKKKKDKKLTFEEQRKRVRMFRTIVKFLLEEDEDEKDESET